MIQCEYCGETFEKDNPKTALKSVCLYRCPNCQRWSE